MANKILAPTAQARVAEAAAKPTLPGRANVSR